MKTSATAFITLTIAVILSLPASAQFAKPDYPLPHPLSPEGLAASLSSDVAATVYCRTLNLQEVMDEGEWDPFSQSITTCDDFGRQSVVEGQTHYLDQWELSYRWMYMYDENGNRTEWLLQNSPGPTYENNRRLTYEFNAAHNEVLRLEEDWAGTWIPSERRVRTYDGEQLIEELEQMWVGSDWSNVERGTYDEQTGIALTETWDGSQWVPDEQSFVTDDNGTSVQTVQDWDGSQWVNDVRYSSSDDFRRVEDWDGSAWVGVQNQLLTYNGFGQAHGTHRTSLGRHWLGKRLPCPVRIRSFGHVSD